ncbi:MAG: type II secretion system GspH family protein, partial [Lactobacillales bacterium]|nr:type II secretion system GspH family protein [Lactobacillales bacterium]
MTKKRHTGKRKSSVKIALAQRMRALAQEIKKFPAETDIPIYKDVAGLERKDPAISTYPSEEKSPTFLSQPERGQGEGLGSNEAVTINTTQPQNPSPHRHSGPQAGIHSNPTSMLKNIHNNESGRTMLETLSVITIIGLLSLMALSGFRYAMKKHRENESLDQISKTVVSSRTGFLLRAHSNSLDEVHEGGGLNYKMIGYVPKRVGIKDIISAVDFNDTHKKKSSSDYTVQPESFRTLIGADVSVFVDTPSEYSVRVARL